MFLSNNVQLTLIYWFFNGIFSTKSAILDFWLLTAQKRKKNDFCFHFMSSCTILQQIRVCRAKFEKKVVYYFRAQSCLTFGWFQVGVGSTTFVSNFARHTLICCKIVQLDMKWKQKSISFIFGLLATKNPKWRILYWKCH